MKKIHLFTILFLLSLQVQSSNVLFNNSELYFLNPELINSITITPEESLEIRSKLTLIDKNIEKFTIEKTIIDGYYKITDGIQRYYVDKDVNHLFMGNAVLFKNGKPIFLDETLDQLQRRLFIQSVNEDEAIIFEAKEEKDRLYVFTDITCPYCNRLHKDVEKINKEGITLVYFPYPRSGLNTNIEKALNHIWCKKTKEEYHKASINSSRYIQNLKNTKGDLGCNKYFTAYYFTMANYLGIKGTPFILNKKGKIIGGYEGYQKFMIEVLKTW